MIEVCGVTMRFEILGPLRVIDRDEVLTISAEKMEVLLATLLIRSGQVVSLNQLITEIWSEAPPRRATDALYVYISQLRKLLDRARPAESAIVTVAPGYRIELGHDELDLTIFQRHVHEGRAAARDGRRQDAARYFGQALDLWRGPTLIELRNGPIVTGFVSWLEEMRLECTERLMHSNLELGRHRELVPELFSLTAEYPLHEAFYRQLMLALYRSERRGDALRVYRSARRVLQDELGLEPGRALGDLQQRILAADGLLDVRPAV
jgi:SARP family transcriptional regulator, regulator of embCAB operon